MDQYVTKPFDQAELAARVNAGMRAIESRNALAARVRELEAELALLRKS